MIRFKNMLKCFGKIELQEDKTHPNPPLKREGVKVSCAEHTEKDFSPFTSHFSQLCTPHPSPLPQGAREQLSCAEHTEKDLFSYSPIHLFTFKKVAFTLAEVLITLGIIGVVSALTLPSIITDYQKKLTIKKLKTTYNILNNAIEMAKTEYGTDVNSWDMPDTDNSEILSNYFAEHYMLPYLKVLSDCKNGTNCKLYGGTSSSEFILSNGSFINVEIFKDTNSRNVRCIIYIYINGKVRNINYARDLFVVELGGIKGGADKNKFLPYAYDSSRSCQFYRMTSLDWHCGKNSSSKYGCFALIMCEGWKIPPDYPW